MGVREVVLTGNEKTLLTFANAGVSLLIRGDSKTKRMYVYITPEQAFELKAERDSGFRFSLWQRPQGAGNTL